MEHVTKWFYIKSKMYFYKVSLTYYMYKKNFADITYIMNYVSTIKRTASI